MIGVSTFVVAGGYSHVCLLENRTSGQPQQSPPRWVIGTGQLCRLRFRPGPLPVGGGGMIPFGSASTTLYSLCPAGHARL